MLNAWNYELLRPKPKPEIVCYRPGNISPDIGVPRATEAGLELTSEFFGLPSSLDKHTQSLLDERLKLAYKKRKLNREERKRLKAINEQLKSLGLSMAFRDPIYAAFEKSRYQND